MISDRPGWPIQRSSLPGAPQPRTLPPGVTQASSPAAVEAGRGTHAGDLTGRSAAGIEDEIRRMFGGAK